MDRRTVAAGLVALAFSPCGEGQKATRQARRPAEAPGSGSGGGSPSQLVVRLLDGPGRLLAEKRVPYSRELTVAWPVWLLPAAEWLEVTDGAYRSGWRLATLGVAEGVFSFRVSCVWLAWPR